MTYGTDVCAGCASWLLAVEEKKKPARRWLKGWKAGLDTCERLVQSVK